MNNIILEALKLGLWRQLDVQFAYMLVNKLSYNQNAVILAIITLSVYINQGNICLPLAMLTPDHLFEGKHRVLAKQALKEVGDLSIEQWQELLFTTNIVSDGSYIKPLVLDRERLYLYRMWNNECLIANFFCYESQQLINISSEKIIKIKQLLNDLFPASVNGFNHGSYSNSNNVNWQKIAVLMALTRKITLISGGPGTGKTFIISKLLVIIILLYSDISLTIKIAAPTGKAVARLNESIDLMMNQLYLMNVDYKKLIFSIETVTLHRLLGIGFDRQNIKRAKYNFACLDYLIIDESSMIDIFMMAKIITFLPSTTKVVFLGDHNQLPSIEPGSIFSDVCYFIRNSYTSKFCEFIRSLTDYILPYNNKIQYEITDNLCFLRKNYRFTPISGIGQLAHAVTLGDENIVLSLLTSNVNTDIFYMVVKDNEDYLKMVSDCALGYLNYLKSITSEGSINFKNILNIFNQYRVLSVLREGPYGVFRLNVLIENILYNEGLINLTNDNPNYVGRPIIITSNAPSSFLFNGETGIILPNAIDKKKLSAYFLLSNGNIKMIDLHKLPKHETNFVMTVHKSQGSEFLNVALIFPEKIMPILTKEVFYTGITRARKYLSIYANNEILNYTIKNSYKRYSGLIDRLKNYKKN